VFVVSTVVIQRVSTYATNWVLIMYPVRHSGFRSHDWRLHMQQWKMKSKHIKYFN